MPEIKVTDLINKFQGKILYGTVYKKEIGMAVSELNDTGHELIEIISTHEIINDTGYNFNVKDYFRLKM